MKPLPVRQIDEGKDPQMGAACLYVYMRVDPLPGLTCRLATRTDKFEFADPHTLFVRMFVPEAHQTYVRNPCKRHKNVALVLWVDSSRRLLCEFGVNMGDSPVGLTRPKWLASC